jgi:hypothetical protein
MARPPATYQRLPGLGAGLAETSRLYLAADHLILAVTSGWTETYRRFYFRDIQAFTIHKTVTGTVWDVIWGALFCLAATTAFAMDAVGFALWMVAAGIFAGLLILNLVRGPTCVCQVRTAVQTRALPPLNRVRSAQKIIAQLKPLIEAAQGTWPPEEMTRRLDEARRGALPVSSEPPNPGVDAATAPS